MDVKVIVEYNSRHDLSDSFKLLLNTHSFTDLYVKKLIMRISNTKHASISIVKETNWTTNKTNEIKSIIN